MKKLVSVFAALTALMLLTSPAMAQKVSARQADSTYNYFHENEIEDYQESLITVLKVINHYKATKDTCKTSFLARTAYECYEALGSFDKALEIILRAEPYSKACSWNEYAKNISAQTSIYITLERFEKIISLVDKIEQEWPADQPDSLIKDLPVNKAIALVYLGRINEAKTIFKSTYARTLITNNIDDQIGALTNLGAFYGMLQEIDTAAIYLKKASGQCADINCESRLELLQNLATLASAQKNYQLSVKYLDSAIGIAQLQKNLRVETELLREVSVATKDLGKPLEAWNLLMKHADLQDTLFSKEMAAGIAKYQMQYESEKKARRIKELELDKLDSTLRENRLKWTRSIYLGAALGVLIIALGLWNRLRYINKTKAVIEKEKERSDELLLNILPAEIAEELKENGKAEARGFELVSILFTDFKEFTEASAKLTAKELVEEINICFEAFDRICEVYSIEKIKTIGDAYMAAGGIPIPSSDSVQNTVLAALEMQAFITQRIAKKKMHHELAFQMRVGIHTGPVVAGIVGVKKFQYDLWGDTVNTASRIENSCEAGKVNISHATYMLLKDAINDYTGNPLFTFESRGKIEAKGKGEIDMYFVSLNHTLPNS